jgi:glycosyltransferase involved in cell wall biosynthesis
MKKILIVAYYFPPSGGPGVQRVLKHIKYLPEFGWQPYVLTVSNGQFPARDESLMEQIPKDIVVERTHIYEPYDLYRLLTGKKKGSAIDVNVIKKDDQKISGIEKIAEFIRATFFIPDARIGWLLTAVKAGKQMIEKYSIDAVYSSSPPYTCSIIARNLKRTKHIPWVAGFRDPWTGFISSPKRWFLPAAIDKGMEHSVFNEADAVECAWEGIIKDAQTKFPDIPKNKFHHVPNGYDSSDFPIIEPRRNDKFTVTYTGSMYGRRNPSSLFAAIELLINRGEINPGEIHLRFVGRFGSEVHEMFDSASFSKSIEIINYVPHDKSIEYLMTSDALLLIVDESKESDEIVPGKVYEYIGVVKPLIAIAPQQSAIAQLIKQTSAGRIAHQSETGLIADIFIQYYQDWKNNISGFSPNLELIKSYERREAAGKLASILNTFAK